MRYREFPIFASAWVLLAAHSMWAQGIVSGSIGGRVTDPSGAPVSGATVTLTNTATGAVSTATTTEDGYYQARYLPIGVYGAAATRDGFQRMVRPDLPVSAASNVTVNFQLPLGAVSQSVTVSAEGALVESQTADRGNVVDTIRLDHFPSQSGNVFGLTFNTAGAQPTSSQKSYTLYDNSNTTSISINGSSPGTATSGFASATNLILVDGVYDRTSYNGAFVPLIASAQSVSEVKVVTSPYSAEYGNTVGGAIISITKSGTNEFHGTAWDNTRVTGLTANQFERNLAGQPRLGTHFWQPGGAIGGPIKRNKLFFFYEMQSILSHTPKSYIGQVPTEAQRSGDFSQTYYNNGGQPALQTIYDPWTVAYNAASGQFTRQPFPGNKIPSGRINPAAGGAFWKSIPLPNAAGDPITLANNYTPTENGTARANIMEYVSHVDWNISDGSRLSVRDTRNDFHSTDVQFYPGAADLNSGLIRANHNAVVGYTKTLSPTAVLDIRTGLERWYTSGLRPGRCATGLPALGFSSLFASQALESCFPSYSFGGSSLGSTYFSGAGGSAPNENPDQINSISGTLAKSLGRHSLKIGGQGILERYYAAAPGFDSGAFGFAVTGSNLNPQVSAPSSGNPVASFLLGVGTAKLDLNSELARQNMMVGFYVQDDITVTPKLKVNVGLRWDWDSSLTDRYNAMTGAFDPTAASPIAARVKGAAGVANCPACSNLVGGLTFPGAGGNSRSPYDTPNTNFGPRLGLAYALDNKTVIRAGWGLFYNSVVYDPGSAGFSQTTNSVLYDPSFNPINLIDNPFPNGVIQPVGAGLGLMTNVGSGVVFVAPHMREPRATQFSVDVQREVGWKTLLSLGYVYNGVSRLPVSRNINALTDSQVLLGASVLNAKVANPFAGLVGSAYALNAPTIAASALLTPYPQYTTVMENGIPIGDMAYHGLQFQLNKRFSDGLSLSVAYTFSKHLGRYGYQNPGDPLDSLQKSLDAYDMPHLLVINEAWEIPVGRGRLLGRNMPAALDLIVGGWMFNGNIRLESGAPYPVATNAIPVPGVDPNAPNQSLNQWVNPAAFTLNTNVYSLVGWSQMYSNLRLPWLHNTDLQLEKYFTFKERVKFGLVTNWVNAFNHPQFWNAPGACNSPSASCFGKIAGFQGQTNLPRQIQVGGKLEF